MRSWSSKRRMVNGFRIARWCRFCIGIIAFRSNRVWIIAQITRMLSFVRRWALVCTVFILFSSWTPLCSWIFREYSSSFFARKMKSIHTIFTMQILNHCVAENFSYVLYGRPFQTGSVSALNRAVLQNKEQTEKVKERWISKRELLLKQPIGAGALWTWNVFMSRYVCDICSRDWDGRAGKTIFYGWGLSGYSPLKDHARTYR